MTITRAATANAVHAMSTLRSIGVGFMLRLVGSLQAAYVMATAANKTSRHHHETNMRFLGKKSNGRSQQVEVRQQTLAVTTTHAKRVDAANSGYMGCVLLPKFAPTHKATQKPWHRNTNTG